MSKNLKRFALACWLLFATLLIHPVHAKTVTITNLDCPSLPTQVDADGNMIAYCETYNFQNIVPVAVNISNLYCGSLTSATDTSSNLVVTCNSPGSGSTPKMFTAYNLVCASLPVTTDADSNMTVRCSAPTPPGTPPTMLTQTAPAGVVGKPYSFTYTASGSVPITFSVSAGALPGGLWLSADGSLNGTPTQIGTYTGTIMASNGFPPAATQQFNITITAPPSIGSSTPPDGTVGSPYQFTWTATGSAPITFAVTSGALPPGLTFTPNGTISGTPTSAGTFTATITASNGSPPNATRTFNITIAPENPALTPPIITSNPPTGGTVGVPYSFLVTATGTAPIQFSVTSGSLPPGLSLSSTGTITGTPSIAGAYSGTISASNGALPNATQDFMIVIASPPPVRIPPTLSGTPGAGVVGVPYSFAYTATGTAPIMFAVSTGALPPGLSLTSAGVITGTPTSAGSYAGTVTASNGYPPAATQQFNITITAPPSIGSSTPPNGTVGSPYSFSFSATGSAPIAFAVTSGALPSGLSFTSTGTISGTPTSAGTFTATVTASNGTLPNATRSFSITINQPPPTLTPPTITSTPPIGGTVGVPYSFRLTAVGTVPIQFNVTSGSLPPGLSLSSTGTISGTPSTAGTYNGTISASNSALPNATQNFMIVIVSPTPVHIPPTLAGTPGAGVVGVPYSFTYTVTGTTPITFAVSTGALPPGLSLTSAGAITGTPTSAGTYSGTVTASNGYPPAATQQFNITITTPPSIGPSVPPDGVVGSPYSFTWSATGSAPIAFAVTSGALPPGLSLASSGTINGTPAATGTFTATVTASNGAPPDATRSFSITIAPAAPSLVPPSIGAGAPGSGTIGLPYSFTFSATGTAPITFALTSGSLPPGLALSSDGKISGTPTQAGTFMGLVTASNGVAPNASKSFSIAVSEAPSSNGAPAITSSGLPNGAQGKQYSFSLTATGKTPISYNVSTGSLPPGLTISPSGVISGTPTQSGTFNGTIIARNGVLPNATLSYSITIGTSGSGTYEGLWWNPAESGWGLSIAQQGPIMFVGWYTYEQDGSSTRYFMSNCAVSGNGCTGSLYKITGGAPLTAAWNGHGPIATVGTGTLSFSDSNTGVFTFVLNGTAGSKNIVRNVFGSPIAPPATDYTGLWWNPNESGWGTFITHQGSNMFVVMFTFDAAGKPLRYVASNCAVAGNGCAGTLYKTSGGSAPTSPWAGPITLTPIGNVTLAFSSASSGTMNFTIDGQSGSKAITKMVFYTPSN